MDCLFDVMQQIIFTLDMADVLIVHRRMLRGFGSFGGTAREFAKRLSVGVQPSSARSQSIRLAPFLITSAPKA